MKQTILFVLILLATAVSAQTHNNDIMTDEQQISALYGRMYSAMIAKDEAVLREVHSEDFVLVHMTGMRQPKEQYINAILGGTLNYYSAETEDLQISVHGDEATLRGHSRVNAAVFGGDRHTWRLALDLRLRKENGAWCFIHSEASTY